MQYVEISIVVGSDPEVDRRFTFGGERQMEAAGGAIGELAGSGLGLGVRDMTLEGEGADAFRNLLASVRPFGATARGFPFNLNGNPLLTFEPRAGSFALERHGARGGRTELGGRWDG